MSRRLVTSPIVSSALLCCLPLAGFAAAGAQPVPMPASASVPVPASSVIAPALSAQQVAHAGLLLTVPPFELGGLAFEGGTVRTLPSRKQYLVANLHTRKLHVLPRAIGQGEMVLGHLRTTENEITDLEILPQPELPQTHIPQTLEKLRRGEPIRVRNFGSSLVDLGNRTNGWQELVYQRSNPEQAFYVGSGTEGHITSISHGLGGSNARYSAALMGTAVYDGKQLSSAAFDCDLAVVALIPNGGEDRMEVFEAVVRQLRARGIEVLLLTDNSNAGLGERSGLWASGDIVARLAERYGCALADTAAYVLEADVNGEKPFADAIHQTPLGHRRWAEAIAGVLSPVPPRQLAGSETSAQPAPESAPGSPSTSALPQTVLAAERVPAAFSVDLLPAHTGGTLHRNQSGNQVAAIYGAPQTRLDLSAGDSVEVSGKNLLAVDAIYHDSPPGFTGELRDAARNLIGTVVLERKTGGSNRARALRLLAPEAVAALDAADQPLRLTVTDGTLRLYALSYHHTAEVTPATSSVLATGQ